MKLTKFAGLAASAALLLSAVPALAATPQEIITNALKNYNPDGASRLSGEVTVNVKEVRYRATANKYPEEANVVMRFDQRALAKTDGVQNSEGRFTLQKFDMKSEGQSISLPNAVHFNWKYVSPTLYGYVEKVPQVLVDALKSEVDLAPYLDQWYKIELPKESSSLLTGSAQAQQVGMAAGLAKELAEKQAVRVIGTEKTYKNAAGETMVRVRVHANKSALAKEHYAQLREAYKIKKYADRRARIAELNKEYADTLKELNKIHAVAVVNQTKSTLDRVEMSVAQTEPKKECAFNKYDKYVCSTVGVTKVNVLAGISILTPDTNTIIVPSDAKVFEPLQNLLTPKE